MLIELNSAAQFYTDPVRCIDLIKCVTDERILLVVSGTFAQQVLDQIHGLHTIVAVFIFCMERETYISLRTSHDKIVDVFDKQQSLIVSIRDTMQLIDKQTLAISLFDQKQRSVRDLSKESASFLCYQLLLIVLRAMPQDERSKIDMLDKCDAYYRNCRREQKKIREFRIEYRRDKAIEWYTKECFLYKLLNKALRTEDIELLYLFRFFIIDLCADLEQESAKMDRTQVLTLYRGQKISCDEFEKLKNGIGLVISINGFLSTTRDMTTALRFVGPNIPSNTMQRVLFKIHANTHLKTVVFADIERRSQIVGEREVLFSLNARFKIDTIEFNDTLDMWTVHLTATDEGHDKVQEYLKPTKEMIDYYSPLVVFGRLLLNDLDQVERAKKYFDMLLKILPSEHPDVPAILSHIGIIHLKKGELNLALQNYELGYDIRRATLPFHHPHIAGSLSNIGNILSTKGQFDEALNYYQRAMAINENAYPDHHVHKAIMLEKIGVVYDKMADYSSAHTYLSNALEMYETVMPSRHPQIATCLGHIGRVYEHQGDHNRALEFYRQQLEMEESSLPADHSYLTKHLYWILQVYVKQGDTNAALKYCGNKLEVLRAKHGESHVSVARTLLAMASVLETHNREEARQLYEGTKRVFEDLNPPDVASITLCMDKVSRLYLTNGMINESISERIKLLLFQRRVLVSDHPHIASTLEILADTYRDMGSMNEALTFSKESLAIFQANYHTNHENVIRLSNKVKTIIDTFMASS
jgi:tetratricopeptide (TPR) repeat protein